MRKAWNTILLLLVLSGMWSRVLFGDFSASAEVLEKASRCQKIASFAPSITQVLEALQYEDRIVAVSDYESTRQRYQSLPKLGGYLNPNKEYLLGLDADLFILLKEQLGLADWLGQMGKRTLVLDHGSISGLSESFVLLASSCADEDKARLAKKKFQEDFHKLRNLLPKKSDAEKVLLFVLDGSAQSFDQGLYVSGRKTLHGELLEALGFTVLPRDKSQTQLRLGPESIETLQPDWIILLSYDEQVPADSQLLEYFARFKGVPAVMKNQIRIVSNPLWGVPGPKILGFAEYIAAEIAS